MSDKGDGKVDGADGADDAPVTVETLTNALRFEKAKNDVLLGEVIALEDEVVNRCMADFDAVVSDESREFWREQLLTNRKCASVALGEMLVAKQSLGGAQGGAGDGVGMRRPLHNRALARPTAPTAVGGGGGSSAGSGQAGGDADGHAAKIRNRAQEISGAERVPFSVAFRRAERELAG